MEITSFFSSSAGNLYKISNGDTTLLIECGVKVDKIKKALNFNLNKVKGILVTHEHKDHSLSAVELVKLGYRVYSTRGTLERIGAVFNPVKYNEIFEIGTFKIIPFETFHDCAEPCGYLIYCTLTKKKLLFATDTRYIKNKFKGITHLMIECNYSEPALQLALLEGRTDISRVKRLRESHFSLENLKEFIKSNDFSSLEEVHLLHLSSDNSDEAIFKKEIAKLTGVPVYVCEK